MFDYQMVVFYRLVVWNIFDFPIYWECQHPTRRTHIFQRGTVDIHTTLYHQPDIQLVGLREKLQETPIFFGEIHGFL